MDYETAKNYWKKKDAEGKKLADADLEEKIKEFIDAHDTMALATTDGKTVNNTPVAYFYIDGNFYFMSEGGRKFANLEVNKNVCLTIFNQMNSGSNVGLQVSGIAELIDPESKEYADFFNHIGEKPADYSGDIPYSIPLIKINVKYLDYFDSTLAKDGYHMRQHLER